MNPPGTIDAAASSLAPRGYGARLRAAREQSGLTVDQVAQQLKLAPRQVQAIEDEDLAVLPEVTYIRGFVRNYARLLRIDAGELLDGLPINGAEPAQGATFRRSSNRMAELPVDSASRASWIRWAVPLALAIAALAFAAYEWFFQPHSNSAASPGSDLPAATAGQPATAGPDSLQSQTLPVSPSLLPEGTAVTPGAAAPPGAAPGAAGGPAGTPASPPTAKPAGAGLTAPDTSPLASSTPIPPLTPPGSAKTAAAAPPMVAAATSSATMSGPQAPSAAEVAHPTGEVRLAFAETSWVEVRDGRGRVLHSDTNPPGSTRVITGDPPLALVIGNANKVRVSFNGQPVDLGQHTHSNIARISLR